MPSGTSGGISFLDVQLVRLIRLHVAVSGKGKPDAKLELQIYEVQ
jgi:hypothetical protein